MQICSLNRIFFFCRSEEVELPEFLWLSVWHQRRHQEPGGRLGELNSNIDPFPQVSRKKSWLICSEPRRLPAAQTLGNIPLLPPICHLCPFIYFVTPCFSFKGWESPDCGDFTVICYWSNCYRVNSSSIFWWWRILWYIYSIPSNKP